MFTSKILTKSLYTRGLQCKKSLWLKLNNNSVLKKLDDSSLSIFSTGDKVGSLACELFPNGEQVTYDNTTREERIALTKKWLNKTLSRLMILIQRK